MRRGTLGLSKVRNSAIILLLRRLFETIRGRRRENIRTFRPMKEIKGMKATVSIAVPTVSVALAGGGKVDAKRDGNTTVFTFDLDVSGDALVLR